MRVLFLPEVEDYLYELIEILYKKEYFGFRESAINYVVSLEEGYKTKSFSKIKKPAPPFLANMEISSCIPYL